MNQKETRQLLKRAGIPDDFNWNTDGPRNRLAPIYRHLPADISASNIQQTYLVSECLRDGLHGAPRYPTKEEMLQYLHALNSLGVQIATIGIFSGNDNLMDHNVRWLLTKMREELPEMTPRVLSLTTEASRNWLNDIAKLHPHLQAIVFRGTAPIRRFVEGWTEDQIVRDLSIATRDAIDHGVEVIGAVEHATQTPPELLRRVIIAQVENGASAFCLADTIGLAREIGAYRLTRFTVSVLQESNSNAAIEWHGHDDKGNAWPSASASVKAIDHQRRIGLHVTAGGIGERAGNLNLSTVIINREDLLTEHGLHNGIHPRRLAAAQALYFQIAGEIQPTHGPAGKNSHHTELGIHAAALLKAQNMALKLENQGRIEEAFAWRTMGRTIYSAVDPDRYGLTMKIGVGPFSGAANVKAKARSLGIEPQMISADQISAILTQAKELARSMTDDEFLEIYHQLSI